MPQVQLNQVKSPVAYVPLKNVCVQALVSGPLFFQTPNVLADDINSRIHMTLHNSTFFAADFSCQKATIIVKLLITAVIFVFWTHPLLINKKRREKVCVVRLPLPALSLPFVCHYHAQNRPHTQTRTRTHTHTFIAPPC